MQEISKEMLEEKAQIAWQTSPEYRQAYERWVVEERAPWYHPFEASVFYRNARYLYRKRINNGGDGNDG